MTSQPARQGNESNGGFGVWFQLSQVTAEVAGSGDDHDHSPPRESPLSNLVSGSGANFP